mmetsp:Transcript_8695/g.17449  ORF Transcript_8695/g.17449 Transcript_8695/m.17449 type:complete len:406 (-) Transcript_8695:8-1225(-)
MAASSPPPPPPPPPQPEQTAPEKKEKEAGRDPPAASTPAPAKSEEVESEIKSYIESGGKLTLAVLACNRPDYLKQTLDSLLDVDGVRKENIVVIQDGKHAPVMDVVHDYGLDLVQNEGQQRSRIRDGAEKIATHYKFAIQEAFNFNKESPAVIIIEDDFLFSPDFLQYFESNAPILDVDPTTFIMSAWNDNGLKIHVRDKRKLHRTNYFPGLGWLMPRKLWEEELAAKWPRTHWDHWMRDRKQHKGRDCIHPEIPRDYHIGVKGTFMDDFHHNTYFKDIGYNKELGFEWDGDEYLNAVHSKYDADILKKMKGGKELERIEQLQQENDQVFVIYISVKPGLPSQPFKPMGQYFKIWHEIERGNYDGIHQFWWENGNYVIVVNEVEAAPMFKELRTGKLWEPRQFKK